MLGGGPYEATTCPECGSTYHWHPEEEEGEDE